MKASDFVGLDKKAAQNKAEAKNMIFRLVAKDGETFLGDPSDPGRNDRVCCTIVDGTVVSAEIK